MTKKCENCNKDIPKDSYFQNYCSEKCWKEHKQKEEEEQTTKKKPGRPRKLNFLKRAKKKETEPTKDEKEKAGVSPSPPSNEKKVGPEKGVLSAEEIVADARTTATRIGCKTATYLLAHTLLQNIVMINLLEAIHKEIKGDNDDDDETEEFD